MLYIFKYIYIYVYIRDIQYTCIQVIVTSGTPRWNLTNWTTDALCQVDTTPWLDRGAPLRVVTHVRWKRLEGDPLSILYEGWSSGRNHKFLDVLTLKQGEQPTTVTYRQTICITTAQWSQSQGCLIPKSAMTVLIEQWMMPTQMPQAWLPLLVWKVALCSCKAWALKIIHGRCCNEYTLIADCRIPRLRGRLIHQPLNIASS